MIRTHSLPAILGAGVVALALALSACSGSTVTVLAPTATGTATAITTPAAPTATPLPSCATLVPGVVLITGSLPGFAIHYPSGAYITPPTGSGGGTGQYVVNTYTLCYAGTVDELNGPFSGHSSTFAYLFGTGWGTTPGMFPDDGATLATCGGSRTCFTDAGDPNPFHFISFDQITTHAPNFVTFQMKTATIAAVTCPATSTYGAVEPQYLLFAGNAIKPGTISHDYQFPPGTRAYNYLGGGYAGGVYVPYCANGSAASIAAFLKQSMQNGGYTITNVTATGFTASYTASGQVYSTDVTANTNGFVLNEHIPQPA